ncbi:hypothetical protein OH76DRAFT_399617 [Lentinus brumalis]|uniref:Uncharacterized protein n=1 Tax=Lentinus brumalis TaxID=2498619 RepID=A0A371DVM0_9APHY|nr:hypothetical protein OH76DRAFT_399617 [Polyporus brumalis]
MSTGEACGAAASHSNRAICGGATGTYDLLTPAYSHHGCPLPHGPGLDAPCIQSRYLRSFGMTCAAMSVGLHSRIGVSIACRGMIRGDAMLECERANPLPKD